MKGVTILYDETRKKRVVQIDVDVLDRKRDELADMLGLIVAESRKDDEMIPWEKARAQLKKAGKL
jgi:hypothetical protein